MYSQNIKSEMQRMLYYPAENLKPSSSSSEIICWWSAFSTTNVVEQLFDFFGDLVTRFVPMDWYFLSFIKHKEKAFDQKSSSSRVFRGSIKLLYLPRTQKQILMNFDRSCCITWPINHRFYSGLCILFLAQSWLEGVADPSQ